MNGSVEGVRVAVCEHPSQAWVLKHSGNALDLCLYSFRYEESVLLCRTLVFICLRLVCAVPHIRFRTHCEHEFSACGDVLILDISLCICLSVEGHTLDVSVFIAVSDGSDGECASCDFD